MCSFSPAPALYTFHTLLSSVVIYSPFSLCDQKQNYHYLCTIQGHFSSVTCVSTSGPGRLQTCIMLCRNQYVHVHSTSTPCIDFSCIAFLPSILPKVTGFTNSVDGMLIYKNTFLLIYFQRDATLHSSFISAKLLYMFRVVSPPIIRSTHNSIYSIWYLLNRYCYLPLSWTSWSWFECDVGIVLICSGVVARNLLVKLLLLPAAIVD